MAIVAEELGTHMKMSFLGRDAIVKRMGSEEVNYKLWKLWHLALNRIWKTHTTNRFISEEKKESEYSKLLFEVPDGSEGKTTTEAGF